MLSKNMSKNCELFINLCHFMKYLLNEILPDQDPTDSVKNAAQDVLSAINKFINKMEFEVSPVFTDFKTDGGEIIAVSSTANEKGDITPDFVLKNSRIIGKEKCFQVTHLPLISISSDTESGGNELIKEKDLSKNKDTADIKPEDAYPKENKESVLVNQRLDNNVDGFITQSSLSASDICSNNRIEVFPSQNKNCNSNNGKNVCAQKNLKYKSNMKPQNEKDEKFLPIENRIKKHFYLNKRPPSPGIINSTKYQEVEMIFADNFLQFYFFSDLELNCENASLLKSNEFKTDSVNHKTNQTDCNESDLSTVSEKLNSLIDCNPSNLPPVNIEEDSIPCGFQAINGCVLSKLLKEAYYCWKCDISVETHSDLQKHLDDWKTHGSPLKGQLPSIFDLCEDCVFSAVVPLSKINQLLEYHQQSHETASKPLINLYEAYHGIVDMSLEKNSHKLKFFHEGDEAFVDNLLRLKKHRERNNDTSQFLGICLICKAFFFNTLEWSFHSYEFGHFCVPNEKYVSCSPCCLVILGYVRQNIKKHLSSVLHLSQCSLSREQSKSDKKD